MNLPFITDWHFYAIAIPAVLLMGISKSGFGAGFGALAVPFMALVVTVPEAAAMMMLPLLFADLLGLWNFRKLYDRALLRFLLPWGLLGVVVGTLLFRLLDAHTVAGVVGVLTLLFLAQRLFFPPLPDSPPPPRWTGALLATASGFTSFVAHAGSPPINAYVIPLRLKPITYTATMAMLFFAVNLSKWIPFAWLGLLDTRNMATSLVLLPFVPIGVYAGIRIAKRVNPVLFYRLVYTGMFLTGCKLAWDGFVR